MRQCGICGSGHVRTQAHAPLRHCVARTGADYDIIKRLRDPSLVTVAEGGARVGPDVGMTLVHALKCAPVIGRGAFASVFDTGNCMCVKVERLSPLMVTQSHMRATCIAIWAGSIRIAPRVRSWQILHGERSGPLYVIEMELVRGELLAMWATRAGRARVDVMRMADKLGQQVAHLREFGVEHGDLHVSNVLVDEMASPWLIDFTFARVRSASDAAVDEEPGIVSAMWREFESIGPHRQRQIMETLQ